MTMLVRPSDEVELIALMPEIVESWRSIGAATEDAMVSALAPGKVAVIEIVGKSTAGKRGDRQEPIGEYAEYDESRSHQRREDRPTDTDLRQDHVRLRVFSARAERPASHWSAAIVLR